MNTNAERRTAEAKGMDSRRFLSLFDFLPFDVGRSMFNVRSRIFSSVSQERLASPVLNL